MAEESPSSSVASSGHEQRPREDGRARWERPALRRLAASDAQMGGANMTDVGSTKS
jgi:hypothetical protein